MEAPRDTQPLDLWLTEVADAEHGVVSRARLLDAGFSRQQIRTRLLSGRLHVRFPGVYAIGRRDLTRHGHWLAGVLFGGDGAALGLWSAAALHGMRRTSGPRPHVILPHDDGRCTREQIAFRRCPTLSDEEVTDVDGIRCTIVARTLLDIAAVSRRDDILRKLLIEAENQRILDFGEIDELLRRRKGNRGVGRLRLAIQNHRHVEVHSDTEVDFLLLCETFELPPPVVNGLFEGRYLVDFAWPQQRLLVEIDTPTYHGTPTAFERDRERDAQLHAAGYRVLRFTARQIRSQPAVIARTVRRVLALSVA